MDRLEHEPTATCLGCGSLITPGTDRTFESGSQGVVDFESRVH
jgi:hypothetical protein